MLHVYVSEVARKVSKLSSRITSYLRVENAELYNTKHRRLHDYLYFDHKSRKKKKRSILFCTEYFS